MLTTIFAAPSFAGYSIVELAIFIVIVAAIAALTFVALRQFEITIPPWVIHVFWIVVVAFVVIVAIKMVATM